jgi:undecaprenyl pyrophosphate synthase
MSTYPLCSYTLRLLDHLGGKLTNRNLTHSHIYNNLETNQSIRSITPLAKGLEKECGKIDIYVRTSDVRRLSDFQMWQVSLNSMGRRADDVGSG